MIKYCLPLSVVSFIIFLCGFIFDNVIKTSLWAAAVFVILAGLVIYSYTSEKITNQNLKEIKDLNVKLEKLSRIQYGLHIINPKMDLSHKVFYALRLLSENIPNRTFVCFSCDNNEISYLTGLKINSTNKPERILQEDPLISDISNRIKALTDYESLKKSGGLLKPISIVQGNNIHGQILTIDFYSNVKGIFVELGSSKLSNIDDKVITEFCKNLALIFEDHKDFNDSGKPLRKTEEIKTDIEIIRENLYESMITNDSPALNGWDFAMHFLPSAKRADFLDIIRLTTDKQMILLGKCSGYGINAALYISRLKLIIKCFIEECQSPAKLLNKISCYLNSDLMPDLFVDITAILYRSKDSQITLAMAGSTIPIINRTRSGFAEIPELQTGIPLGLFNQGTEPYKDQVINIMPGDGILLHTDGITDFPGKGLERISNEDLKNILDKIPEQNADEMLRNILKQIKNQNIDELPEEDHSIIYLKAE